MGKYIWLFLAALFVFTCFLAFMACDPTVHNHEGYGLVAWMCGVVWSLIFSGAAAYHMSRL